MERETLWCSILSFLEVYSHFCNVRVKERVIIVGALRIPFSDSLSLKQNPLGTSFSDGRHFFLLLQSHYSPLYAPYEWWCVNEELNTCFDPIMCVWVSVNVFFEINKCYFRATGKNK